MKPYQLVLASNNTDKVRELAELLTGPGIDVKPQSAFGTTEVEETGLTFVENAILKARNAAAHASLPAIADDSGLEVDALHGAPGIYSARYAGPKGDATANNRKLLEDLQDVQENERTARFQCIIVYVRHAYDPTPVICQGTWEGRILQAPQGANGFGYDPVFFVPGDGCSAAELSPERKNTLSHRGQALRQFLRALSRMR